MKSFEKKINSLKNRQNFLTLSSAFINTVTIFLILFGIHNFVLISSIIDRSILFYFNILLKIFFSISLVLLIHRTSKNFLNKLRAARYIDFFNGDIHDTFQNALELKNDKNADGEIVNVIIGKADQVSQKTKISADYRLIKNCLALFLIVFSVNAFIYFWDSGSYAESLKIFITGQLPEIPHKDFVELEPENKNVTRNDNVQIKVLNPELDVEHRLFYREESTWKEIVLYNYEKVFSAIDFSFDYFIKTPYAQSDTFRITVYELPAIKKMQAKIQYPGYTKIDSEIDSVSNGNYRVIKNTEIEMEITSNNPLEEARILIANGEVHAMERLGKNNFKAKLTAIENITYSFDLEDFLGNRSHRINKTITVVPDQKPEIKFIAPAKDTILTQNMILPLKIFAADDFGLKNLELKYIVNSSEEKQIMLVEKINTSSFEYNYNFDLVMEFLLPGDKVTYWAEITDNSPDQQKSSSQRYVARFPSITEIYEEIEEQELAKSEVMKSNLEQSKELQEEFEQKRRELMKKDEISLDDKKDLEKFLDKQENLSEQIENVTKEYEDMIRKFDENQALSKETIEKMEKIRELMEEISNEELREAMKKLQESMEDIDRDVLMKAMEEFKFSMEEYAEKLDRTIDLLESVKKEQSLQKSLEIAQEMKKMQDELNKKTSESGEQKDGQQLSQEQDKISENLDKLESQLDKSNEMLDPKKDEQVKKAMEELMDQMEKDNLKQDMQESSQSLSENNMEKAQQSQKSASQKMEKMISKMQNMKNMMSSGNSQEIQEMVKNTIERLILFSQK
ncbi:MAG: hypothetical protein PHR06_10120, partial [Candidatus Cloacimonetes bacterium]|nr:hypothetical protein [Candidatus Cloacimonadota bacterium]